MVPRTKKTNANLRHLFLARPSRFGIRATNLTQYPLGWLSEYDFFPYHQYLENDSVRNLETLTPQSLSCHYLFASSV